MIRISIVLLMIIAIVAILFAQCGPGGDGVIGRLDLPDGSIYEVRQQWNGDYVEPYTVGFFYREKSGPWGWCYIGHQDTRWWQCYVASSKTGDEIYVIRGKRRVATYSRANSTFTLHPSGRTVTAPQERLEMYP